MKRPARLFPSEWKIFLPLWGVLFVGLLAYGIAQHFEDLWLFAIAMALASWGVVGWGMHTVYKWREWRGGARGE